MPYFSPHFQIKICIEISKLFERFVTKLNFLKFYFCIINLHRCFRSKILQILSHEIPKIILMFIDQKNKLLWVISVELAGDSSVKISDAFMRVFFFDTLINMTWFGLYFPLLLDELLSCQNYFEDVVNNHPTNQRSVLIVNLYLLKIPRRPRTTSLMRLDSTPMAVLKRFEISQVRTKIFLQNSARVWIFKIFYHVLIS